MSASYVECRVVKTGMGDRESEPYYELLRSAFRIVADPKDWRGPINTVIPEHLEGVVTEAIIFMTATRPQVMGRMTDGATGQKLVRLAAIGYRAGPAGG